MYVGRIAQMCQKPKMPESQRVTEAVEGWHGEWLRDRDIVHHCAALSRSIQKTVAGSITTRAVLPTRGCGRRTCRRISLHETC